MGLPHASTGIGQEFERLRWFAPKITAELLKIGRAHRAIVRVDPVRLAAAFLAWRRAAPADLAPQSAGALLRELLTHAPVAMAMPPDAPEGPARFWPEGFACVTLCLGLRRQLVPSAGAPGPAYDDLRVWWSFRENFAEDAATAPPFLELFAGAAPDWAGPAPQPPGPGAGRQGPQLWLVPNGPALPRGTARVVFDLAALSDADAIWVRALASAMADHGAPEPEAEVARRFLHRPVAAAVTRVAERTGMICPSGFAADLEQRAAVLMEVELRLHDGAREAVAALARQGVAVRIVAPAGTLPETLVSLRVRFPEADVDCGDIVALAAAPGESGRATVVSTSQQVIARAARSGLDTLGLAGQTAARQSLLAAGAQRVLPAEVALLQLRDLSEPQG